VIALCTTAGAIPAGDDATPRELFGWGRVLDPSRDCDVSLDVERNRLRITVPGTPHVLSAEDPRLPMNAPRVVRRVRGDFTADVRVLGQLKPGRSKTTYYDPFHGAGLIVWHDFFYACGIYPQDAAFLKQKAYEVGYPVLIKPIAGGGGKGMHRVDRHADFDQALETAQREGQAAFGDARVLIEKFVTTPRHIELQIFAELEILACQRYVEPRGTHPEEDDDGGLGEGRPIAEHGREESGPNQGGRLLRERPGQESDDDDLNGE